MVIIKEETLKAAKIAGLNVGHIVNEPTAAVTYAKLKGGAEDGYYIIYDFGGGTFDCTIADISSDEVEVKTSEGVQKLGGKDLDNELIKIVQKKYKEIAGKDLATSKFDLNDAERYKIDLSAMDEITVFIDDVSIDITRAEYEQAIQPLVSQSLMSIESALASLDLNINQIKDVILVGGTSRTPLIQNSIAELLGKKPLMFGNPDESVALGAAIYASKKNIELSNVNQRESIDSFAITDVCTKNYGTLALDGSGSKKILIVS